MKFLRTLRQAFWSVDAFVFVLAYFALLLVLPIRKTDLPIAGR